MSQRGEPASAAFAAAAAAAAPVPQGQPVYRQVGRYLYEDDRLIYRVSREGEHVPYASYEDDPFAALLGEDEGGWTPGRQRILMRYVSVAFQCLTRPISEVFPFLGTSHVDATLPGRRTPLTPVTPPESRPRLARSPADLERWRLADERLAREEARQRERQLQPAGASRGGGPSRPFTPTPTTMHTQVASEWAAEMGTPIAEYCTERHQPPRTHARTTPVFRLVTKDSGSLINTITSASTAAAAAAALRGGRQQPFLKQEGDVLLTEDGRLFAKMFSNAPIAEAASYRSTRGPGAMAALAVAASASPPRSGVGIYVPTPSDGLVTPPMPRTPPELATECERSRRYRELTEEHE
ncbi:unnamed protein product [Vitrella brassicaformis CCMP3155]|uniref:Uncharacterized protein n=1 Tax=Vitrella brassicaformis (strain CCMP3155) TaxID=1169540 RepID=A0A0G4GGA6_VITBC|nr:unnamed protein product [Vitrella brassicaformis CCMP3155]|eukprot:CEM28652.1 unnamed protein product [Vitrella brassicaformis CCMP3155]